MNTYPDQGQFLIRDRNRHGWTQIFAPPYGWIDIEVTPNRPAVPRNVLVPTSPTTEFPPELPGSAEFDPDYLEYLEDLDEIAMMEAQFRAAAIAARRDNEPFIDIPIVPTTSAATAIAIVLLAIGGWRWNLRGQPQAVRAYTQFLRIATILGYRRPSHESAREFTNQVGEMTGRYADARIIIDAFEKTIYGPPETETQETLAENTNESETQTAEEYDEIPKTNDPAPDLGQAWRSLSRAMLKHRTMSLFGMTPPYVPDETQQQYRFTT